MFTLFVVFICDSVGTEQTNLYELVEKGKKASVYPVANYQEGHIIGKCDKDSTKKFAHFKSSALVNEDCLYINNSSYLILKYHNSDCVT